jgi:hypothetical protein
LDAREWDFYTRNPKFKRLLERRGYEIREDHQGLWAGKIPLEPLTVRKNKPRVSRRKLTEAQQRALQEGRFKSKSLDADPEISSLDSPDVAQVGGEL